MIDLKVSRSNKAWQWVFVFFCVISIALCTIEKYQGRPFTLDNYMFMTVSFVLAITMKYDAYIKVLSNENQSLKAQIAEIEKKMGTV